MDCSKADVEISLEADLLNKNLICTSAGGLGAILSYSSQPVLSTITAEC